MSPVMMQLSEMPPHKPKKPHGDWHQLAEDRFARDIIAGLVHLAEREKLKKLVIVAPARTLAELRRAMPEQFTKLVVAEIVKDLTKHPVSSIAQHLMAELAA